MIKLTILSFLILVLISCDPGYAVIASNHTTNERKVEVIMTNINRFHALDSIFIVDTQKGFKVPITKDVSNLTYSFILHQGKDAILQQGIGTPDFTERVIVANADTIALSKDDKRVKINKQGLSTSVTVEIK